MCEKARVRDLPVPSRLGPLLSLSRPTDGTFSHWSRMHNVHDKELDTLFGIGRGLSVHLIKALLCGCHGPVEGLLRRKIIHLHYFDNIFLLEYKESSFPETHLHSPSTDESVNPSHKP